MNTLAICRKRGWKRRSRSNNASAFLSFFAISLVSLLIICSISTVYFSVPVYAAGGWQYTLTVWELILSLLTGSGSAPVSAAANQAGMASPLGTYTVAELASGEVSVAQCDAAIQALTSSSNAASQAAGGIAQSFATTAAQSAEIAETLASAGVEGVEAASSSMSAGENLANTAAASVGAGSIVGMLGMNFTGAAALGAGAVAVVSGIGLGYLAHNVLDKFANYIKYQVSLDKYSDSINNLTGNGGQIVKGRNNTSYAIPNGSKAYLVPGSTGKHFWRIYKLYSSDNNVYYWGTNGTIYTSTFNSSDSKVPNTLPSKSYYGSNNSVNNDELAQFEGFEIYNDSTAFYDDLSNLGDISNNLESPDLVNPNGNFTYNPQTNNYNYNYENNPTYNTTNQTLQPIYNTDYEQFINNTNYNTTNNIDNSQTFQDFISNYLTEYTAPAPDTDPDIPEQPVKPTVTPNTPEQVEQNKEMMLPVDLKDYFPFCIPFDIYALMTHFEDINREAPQIDIDLDLGAAGEYTINVDLSAYDDAASILRALELIAFIIGLMVAARKLIGD